jgi:isochorismatase family protein
MPAVPLFTSSTWIALRRERADRRHRRRRQAGEPDVVKNYPSSFEKTNLDDLLKGFGVEEVTLAGFMTHVCVNSTARAAFNHGYRATVVGNATATRSLPNPAGGVVSPASWLRFITFSPSSFPRRTASLHNSLARARKRPRAKRSLYALRC